VTRRCFIRDKTAVVNNATCLFVLQDMSCAYWYLYTRQPRTGRGFLRDINTFVETCHAAFHDSRVKLWDVGLSRLLMKHAGHLDGILR